MSPALRGENIPRGTGPSHDRIGEPGEGEVRVWCPLGCGWATIRPEKYGDSAREAHRIAHEKGWVADAS